MTEVCWKIYIFRTISTSSSAKASALVRLSYAVRYKDLLGTMAELSEIVAAVEIYINSNLE